MKYAHYDNATKRILGWYSEEVHGENIPTPNIDVTDEVWQAAIDSNHNRVNPTTKTTGLFDYRTPEEKAAQAQASAERADDEADASEIRNTPAVKTLIRSRPAQIDNYIDTNVTDLASAKDVLKILTKAISAIGKQSFR